MKQKVSLVLSGGGARGIAHIGVIEELEKQGYEISSIAGTSIGSVVGGVYAVGKLEAFKNWLLSLDKLKVFNLVDFTFNSLGMIKGDKVFKEMKKFISDKNIEDLKIPYAAVTVDLLKKEEVVFTQGSLYKALRASVAIPSVLTPVRSEKALLVDGGILNNIPVNHARRIPGDILIAVNVNANIPVLKPLVSNKEAIEKRTLYQDKIKSFQNQLKKVLPENNNEHLGYFDLVNRTINIMTYTIAQIVIEKNPPDILVNISRNSCGTFDFYKGEELVEIGRHATVKALRNIKII